MYFAWGPTPTPAAARSFARGAGYKPFAAGRAFRRLQTAHRLPPRALGAGYKPFAAGRAFRRLQTAHRLPPRALGAGYKPFAAGRAFRRLQTAHRLPPLAHSIGALVTNPLLLAARSVRRIAPAACHDP